MIGNYRVLVVIPARGGSKSVPDKNIRPLGGKPLLAWSIEVAQATDGVDRIVVSTDSEKIEQVAKAYGADVSKRPSELATDNALVIDAVRHLISQLQSQGEQVDVVVLLEPTCPFRSAEDVEACLQLLMSPQEEYDSVATFAEAALNPHRAWKIEGDTPTTFIPGTVPWLPRQQLPPAFQLNGAVYAFFADRLPSDSISFLFGKAAAVVMPKARSVDIDSEVDLILANSLVNRHSGSDGRT